MGKDERRSFIYAAIGKSSSLLGADLPDHLKVACVPAGHLSLTTL